MPTFEQRDLVVGQRVERSRIFKQADFDRFAHLSGDDNPIHVDPEFAARTKFGRPVAHGMLLYSALWGLAGSDLPGPGSIPLGGQLKFPSPTFVDEKVSLAVEVTDLKAETSQVVLAMGVIKGNGELGLEGTAEVWLPDEVGSPRPQKSTAADSKTLPGDPWLRNLRLGQQAELRRTFRTEDVDAYRDLAADHNPIFLGDSRQIPGVLLGGLFSTLLGTRLPGPGTNYLKQKLQFLAPAPVDEEIIARVEIVRIRAQKQIVNLRTTCQTGAGNLLCEGDSLVLVSDVV